MLVMARPRQDRSLDPGRGHVGPCRLSSPPGRPGPFYHQGMTTNDTEHSTGLETTRAERWAGVAGAIVGVIVVLICFDLASGGWLSGKISAKAAKRPCGCADDDHSDS